MNIAGLTDLPANAAGGATTCACCGTASRVQSGLCLKCLLEVGLDSAEEESEPACFAATLDAIPVADAGWPLGAYDILEEIGRGGMGVIYRARQRLSRRIVALKRILSYHADSPETVERFRRETEAAASLDHPNILPIYEVAEGEDGLPFFSMKFAPAGSLLQTRSQFAGKPRESVELMTKVARAMHYAHEHGILHRDLKPGNILLGPGNEPWVSDFGLAKWLDKQTDLTRSLAVFGTPGYIAPEQANGPAAHLTRAADIYSMGAILFELLAGRPPFLGEHAWAVLNQAREKPAPRLRSIVRSMSRDLDTICARCLEREPTARYRSAASLAEDLERWLEGRPIIARPVVIPARIWRWSRRNPKLVATAAGCLLLGALSIWLVRGDSDKIPQIVAPEKSIAVLPFHAIGGDEQITRLAEGIHDEILTSIARNASLTVISQGSVLDPRLNSMSPAAKGEALGVKTLMEGSLQRNGENFRVNARLVEARTGKTLHARTFEADESNIFGLQDRIAQDMAAQLQPGHEKPAQKAAPTENINAYEMYLRAREFERRPENEQGLNARQAVEMYEQALKLDPDFVLAEVRLAYTYARLYWQENDSNLRPAYLSKTQHAVEHALQLQPDLPEAHAALGYYYYYGHRDYDHALQEFRVAQEKLPNDSEIADAIGLVQRRKGLWDESLANLTRATRLDPLNARFLTILADTYDGLRRYDEAEHILDRELALVPDSAQVQMDQAYIRFKKIGSTAEIRRVVSTVDPARESDDVGFIRWDVNMLERKYDQAIVDAQKSHLSEFETSYAIFPRELFYALAYWAQGDLEAAKPYFEQSRIMMEPVVQKGSEGPRLRIALAIAYAGLGRKSDAIQQGLLATDERSIAVDTVAGPPIAASLARVYTMVGEREKAIRLIETLASVPFGLSASRIKSDPCWDPLRGDPKFEKITASRAP